MGNNLAVLLLKDIKNNYTTIIVAMLMSVYLFTMGYAEQTRFMGVYRFCIIVAAVIPFISLIKEERNNGYFLMCSMPITKRDLILSKYIYAWTIFFAFLIIMILTGYLIATFIFGCTAFFDINYYAISDLFFWIIFVSLNFAVFIPMIILYGYVEYQVIVMVVLNFMLLILPSYKRKPGIAGYLGQTFSDSIIAFNNFAFNIKELHGYAGYILFILSIILLMNYLSYRILSLVFNSKNY